MGYIKNLCCQFFFFVIVVDITELAGYGVLSELFYAVDLVLMGETIDGIRNKLLRWKETFVSKGFPWEN